MDQATRDWLFSFRWLGTIQFIWIALLALNALQVLRLPWALLLAPLWAPFVLLIVVELYIRASDAIDRWRSS